MSELELTGQLSFNIKPLGVAADACEMQGRHVPHAMWNWRCERCSCVLCTDCGEDLDSCRCSKVARP